MTYILANAGPIAAATLAGLLVGMVYLRLAGAGRPSVGLVVVAVLAESWLASILAGALILAPAGAAPPWIMALASAVVVWIGFVLPTLVVTQGVARVPPGRNLLDAGHWLAVMLAQAAVLQASGLVRPA